MGSAERFTGANVIEAGRLSPYWGEHAARYLFALEHIEGRSVMDIACGTGYGMALLKTRARAVTGVDVDPVAAREALKECDGVASVVLGDGTQLPFADEHFDAITSFETLEHLHARGDFLRELDRVLKPGGILILSTPNANYTMPINGTPTNPYHVHEYEPAELRNELSEHFVVERFVGQSLSDDIRIPPFQDAQRRLPKDPLTQTMLFGWRVFNKIPFTAREKLSDLIWKKPFYATESDYEFRESSVETAPVLVAICKKV